MKCSPCYNDGNGCPRRSVKPNCHEYCEEYLKWRENQNAANVNRRKPAQADAHTKATIARNCKRAKTKRMVGQK